MKWRVEASLEYLEDPLYSGPDVIAQAIFFSDDSNCIIIPPCTYTDGRFAVDDGVGLHLFDTLCQAKRFAEAFVS